MQNLAIRQERFHGIDLLRTILSLWVIIIHVLYWGGPASHATPTDTGFYVGWFIGNAIICTVNCFAIISGFVMYHQEFKYTAILRHFLTVVYHGLVITAVFYVCSPEMVSEQDWMRALLPVSRTEYWYFSAYFCAFFFMPLIIQGMRMLTKRQAGILVVSLIVVLSVLPHLTGKDPFYLERGFSALWLIALFVIGTYWGKYGKAIKLGRRALFAIYAVCVCISFLDSVLSGVFPSIDGLDLTAYNSPTTIIAAMALVLLFSSLSLSTSVREISKFCVPFTFSIYIVHEHPLIRQAILIDRFLPILQLSAPMMIVAILSIAIVIWAGCFILDLIRQYVFMLLNVDGLLQQIEEALHKLGIYQQDNTIDHKQE